MSDPTMVLPPCPNCRTPGAPGETFCRNCGTQLLAPTIAALSTEPPRTPPLSTIVAPRPAVSPVQPPPVMQARRKRRGPLLLGCLLFLGLIVVAAGAGGFYVWRRASYTPPERKTPDIPQRVAGTLTEFPVDSDPNAPARPASVQTEALGGATAKSSSASSTRLPPGIDRTQLAKGATAMTSATYRPQRKSPSSGSSTTPAKDDVYICVLTVMPNQPRFGEGLVTSTLQATNGQRTPVTVQSPKGAVYTGSDSLG